MTQSSDSPLNIDRQNHTSGTHNRSDASFCYSKRQRLLTKSEFTAVFDDAILRASHPCLLILARPTNNNQSRLGLVIAKKHVKKAVGRNLIKRISRESFRQRQHKLGSIDAIVLARRGADALSAEELRSILNGLWSRIRKRYQTVASDV